MANGAALAINGQKPLTAQELATLSSIEQRALWLATAMVDHANRVRPIQSGLKVGGHQASSASILTIMVALWFRHLQPEDLVSVKPHASPALHAIEYLLGRISRNDLQTLRDIGGLQSYPSRTKDPFPADFSTGSVGIGATAPVWAAVARRYVDSHFTHEPPGAGGRMYALLGDAELDEGACWEAVLDPVVSSLGEVVWVVDYNRQSLDRVIPTFGATRLAGMFEAAGWQVLVVKYGKLLTSLMDRPGGHVLRDRIDQMTNPEYQRLLRHPAATLRDQLCADIPDSAQLYALLADVDDNTLYSAVRNLGGHDFAALDVAFRAIDDTRPTVVFAYTVKGKGLPSQGHPQNHSALLSAVEMTELASALNISPDDPWTDFPTESIEGAACRAVAERLEHDPPPLASHAAIPADLGRTPAGTTSTQAALGRTLLDLRRANPAVAERIVTVTPDVSSSTNLGGWVNITGVWSPDARQNWFADDADTVLHWRESPAGQHIELGIAETNLVGLLGELGATWSRWGEPLLPIGVLYDTFLGRALEPWSFGMYAGGQSILVGTPSGVTLAAEGGAHQSIITPSIGLEQPGCIAWEPAFAIDTEWCLLAALAQLGRPGGSSAYLRLSTRPVVQALAAVPDVPAAREHRRRHVVGGGYRLVASDQPALTIAAMGAMVPEALEAAAQLQAIGFATDVVCVTSPGLLFEALQTKRGLGNRAVDTIDTAFPQRRATPMITLLDGHPHTLAFLATIHGVPATHLGVSQFGQSGDLGAVQHLHGIDVDAVVGAALDLVD